MMRQTTRSLRTTLLAATLLAAVFAGCLQAEDDATSASQGARPEASVSAQPAVFDEESGAVAGVVTSDSLEPLPDAMVGLDGDHWTTQTAEDGTFSFSRIPPGRYVLLVQRLGFDSHQSAVEVRIGEVADLKVQMTETPVVEPYTLSYEFTGYITCTIGAFGVLSEECGQGLQTDLGTFGRNPNNKIDWKWNATDVKDLQTMLIELNWRPGSAAASKLTLYVAHGFTCTPSCGEKVGGVNYCDTDNNGPPVQRCQIDDLKIKDPATQLPWDMTARAWGAPVAATEVPNIVLEQSFTMYRTEFFGLPMPEGFSAIADA